MGVDAQWRRGAGAHFDACGGGVKVEFDAGTLQLCLEDRTKYCGVKGVFGGLPDAGDARAIEGARDGVWRRAQLGADARGKALELIGRYTREALRNGVIVLKGADDRGRKVALKARRVDARSHGGEHGARVVQPSMNARLIDQRGAGEQLGLALKEADASEGISQAQGDVHAKESAADDDGCCHTANIVMLQSLRW